MKTYITVTLTAEGKTTNEITRLLKELGFLPVLGDYDYCYDWGKKRPSIIEIMALADRTRNALQGSGASLKFKTID